MVDVVIQNVPSLNVQDALHPENLAADNSRWQKPEYFHPQCWIDYSNQTSVENWCVFGLIPFLDISSPSRPLFRILSNHRLISHLKMAELIRSWLGDDKLALMDVNTENAEIQQALQNWISDYVKEYGIDGLRIDGE